MAEKRKTVSLTLARLKEVVRYDPISGELTAIELAHGRPIGFKYDPQGKISIDAEIFFVSNICWFYIHGEWPTELVDHRNRNKSDNSEANLRLATHTQNQYNKVSHSPHGFKGVTWRDRKRNPWLAKIRVDGVRINLGSFPTKEAAGKAYEEACIKYHGEFAQLGTS